MPSPIAKSFLLSASLGLCACSVPPDSDVYHPYTPPRPIGEAYDPPIQIEANPARFPLGGTTSIIARIHNRTGGSAPNSPGLRLRIVAADANGNYPATDGTYYPADNLTAQPLGPQNGGWSEATFDNVQAPAQAQKLAIIVNYRTWSGVLGHYMDATGAGNEGVAIFRKSCIPINNRADCMWTKESG